MTYIINGSTGEILSTINYVGGVDQGWYNPGEGKYYLGASNMSPGPVLGVIDARSRQWLQISSQPRSPTASRPIPTPIIFSSRSGPARYANRWARAAVWECTHPNSLRLKARADCNSGFYFLNRSTDFLIGLWIYRTGVS